MNVLRTVALLWAIVIGCADVNAQDQSSYCLGANELIGRMTFNSREKMDAEITAIHQRCQAGDIITLFGAAAGLSPYFCSFERSIVVRGNEVICVLAPQRPIRR